jgi:Uma2 family endonuclease
MPLALPSLTGEPEPDLAVVRLNAPINVAGRPTSAMLIIEVAESSLAYHRDRKGPLYAAAGIQEYWLVNLPERCLEVYRHPVPVPQSFSAWRNQECQVIRAGEQVAPLVASEVEDWWRPCFRPRAFPFQIASGRYPPAHTPPLPGPPPRRGEGTEG